MKKALYVIAGEVLFIGLAIAIPIKMPDADWKNIPAVSAIFFTCLNWIVNHIVDYNMMASLARLHKKVDSMGKCKCPKS